MNTDNNLQVYREFKHDAVKLGCLYLLWRFIIKPILAVVILLTIFIGGAVLISLSNTPCVHGQHQLICKK